jgi:hypothetical protein
MINLITRVARAICDAEWCTGHYDSGALSESERGVYGVMARAAIAAMREPTAGMIGEGESAASVYLAKPTNDEGVPHVWRAMIDAALNEKSPQAG